MYAIETELGRFVAEDEKSAKKLLRAAEAKAAEAERVAAGKRDAARADARSNALFLLEKTFRGDAIEIVDANEAKMTRLEEWTIDERTEYKGWRLGIWTRNGEAYALFPVDPPRVTGVILNGAGWPLAVEINCREWQAVGGCDGTLFLYPMPERWTPDMQLPDPNDLGYLDAISDGAAR